ncbi:MAG: hypothetical protein ACTHL8_26515 [Burkholderiaceae bacterium]
MRHRTLTILWPSFLMAGVLEGVVFSLVDPRDIGVERWADGLSPLGVYTLGFLLFWAVVSCASALTALLVLEQDGAPPP